MKYFNNLFVQFFILIGACITTNQMILNADKITIYLLTVDWFVFVSALNGVMFVCCLFLLITTVYTVIKQIEGGKK